MISPFTVTLYSKGSCAAAATANPNVSATIAVATLLMVCLPGPQPVRIAAESANAMPCPWQDAFHVLTTSRWHPALCEPTKWCCRARAAHVTNQVASADDARHLSVRRRGKQGFARRVS